MEGFGSEQPGEEFKVVCGSGWGFGAPWFVRPFLQHSRTAGKLGDRGRLEQCRTCKSVYPDESDGTSLWCANRFGVARVNAPDGGGGRLALFVGSPG